MSGGTRRRPFTGFLAPTEACRFGEGHSGRMQVVDGQVNQVNWKSHEAMFGISAAINGTKSKRQCVVQYLKEGGDHVPEQRPSRPN